MNAKTPDEIVAVKADLLVRLTTVVATAEHLMARIEADEPVGLIGTPEQIARLKRSDRALATIEKYLRILENVYGANGTPEQRNDADADD